MHPTILPRRYAPAKREQSPYLTLSGCVLLSQGGSGVRLAQHRRRRQELRRQRCTARRIGGCDKHTLRRQRCTARPRFTRPAWPRRALRSHDHQRAPRKLSAHAVALCSPCAYHSPHYTAQALRAVTAAYPTLARLSARITFAKRACSRLLRIMSPTILPRCHARRPRFKLRSHDCQRASRKLSVYAAALSSPCANRIPNYTAQKKKG
jgi:hypothetical protein